jgi:hypothetical protein
MTQYKELVKEQRLKLSREKSKWYIHVNNGGGYTEIKQGNIIRIKNHKTGKIKIIKDDD